MTTMLRARILNPGEADAPALCLGESLSFWGGFNPADGVIIDRVHPQVGESVAGKIILMPESRGSAGTPGGVSESIRRGAGPAAVILGKADVNIAVGAMVADRLFGTATPVLVLESADYAAIRSGDRLRILRDGAIAVSKP
jgi:uncharacterized protein